MLVEYPDGVHGRDEAIAHRLNTAGIRRKITHDQVDVLNKSALIYIAAKNMGFEPDGMSQEQMKEDLQDNDFSLEFDPFRLCLFATHKEQDQLTRFMPGSMTRQTHLQMLTYLCMFEYLKDNFRDFIYLPILIIDSANQPMGIEIFKEVYPTITQLADSIGVQTIFMSKDRLDNIPEDDFIDISAGLNKFHKKS